MTTVAPELLGRLHRLRSEALDEANGIARRTDGRGLTTGDALGLQERLDDIRRLDADIERLSRPPVVQVRSEPLTYERGNGHSFCWDLMFQHRTGARARLARHAREMEVELAPQRAAGEARLADALAAGLISGGEQRGADTTTGHGGGFAPPLWVLDQFSSIGRAGRVLGALATQIPLPRGWASVNAPRMTAGTAVATQQDGGAVTQTDVTDAAVTGKVCTIAGKQDLSVQMRDQAGVTGADEYLFKDLVADYNRDLEVELVGGSGSGGHLQGMLGVAGTSTTYTDASPTPGELLVSASQCASLTATARGLPPTVLLAHGRRWFWLAGQTDTTGRSILDLGDADEPVGGGGPPAAGTVLSVPTFMDMAIPTTLGGGTEDRLIFCRPDDCLLFEGEPTLMVADEVLSGTLQVRLLYRRSVAWLPHRWPSSIGVLSGTGCAAPAGY